MSVQHININQTRSAAQQKNKKLLSVKQYSDCVEKSYLVPATTPEQRLTPVLYSAILPGLGQSVNGDNKKSKKMMGIAILSALTFFSGFFVGGKRIKGKAGTKEILSWLALSAIGGMTMFINLVYSIMDAYKNAKTEVVEITKK